MNKTTAVHRFLAFLAQYLPLDQAILATLGGEGLEPHLWQEAGVAGDHGWLIEQRDLYRNHLDQHLPYNICPDLATFPDEIQRLKGAPNFVDAFHLDLCGTLEKSIDIFAPVFPLITSGVGQCLAVTVSDSRSNRSLAKRSGGLTRPGR